MTESVLERVRHALAKNTDLYVSHVEEDTTLLKLDSNEPYSVEFFVAPLRSTSNAEELQRFMLSLVPDITPSDMNSCWAKAEFHFGRLTFNEDLGLQNVTRVFDFIDGDFARKHGAKNNRLTITEQLPVTRKITIHVYPCKSVVDRVRQGSIFKFFMSRSNLENIIQAEARARMRV